MTSIDYKEHISRALDYIEEHLPEDMDNALLARVAGYSEYHFLRVFKETVKLTPADYIRKRRLTEIAKRLVTEQCSAAELAFAYGFNSKENFTRAFKAEHGILPTEFKNAFNSLKLYPRKCFDVPSLTPKVTVLELKPFRLIAYPSDESFHPRFWNKYNAKKWSKKLSGGTVAEDIGAGLWNEKEQKLDYYIGIPEQFAKGDLTGTVTIDISGGIYACFETPPSTTFDFVNTIHRTWEYISAVWLPENGYERTGGFEFEAYTEESRTFSDASIFR